MSKQSQSVYQFKISLDGIKPKIWRRIQIPEVYTFWDFHVAIQDAMGWLDCHLHQFWVINPKTSHNDIIGIPMDDGWEDEIRPLPGWKTPISSYFSLSNKRATYEYDFGDSWKHKILLEKVLPIEPAVKYPRCLAGGRSCPPEDCGGVWGYEELLEIMKDPGHEEHKKRMEWVGGHFDPENFKPDLVQFADPMERLKLMMK
jgi:Plasmid pRiA4b ORF-3-like protein